MSDTIRPTLKLAVALAVTWLVLAGPASMVGGSVAVVGLSLAVALCFLPHLLVAAFVFVFQPQERPLAGLVVAMALRMVIVMLGAGVICWHLPAMRGVNFVVWLAPCYFVTLAVETRLMVVRAGGALVAGIVNGSSVAGTTLGG